MNAVEIEEAVSRLAEAPFDPATFPYAFLEAFGNKETTLKRLKSGNTNQSDLAGGLLQRNNIHLKVCAEGEVTATLAALRQSAATARYKAKFILATDGKSFEAENVVDGETVACAYADFHDHFGFFLPLAGITTVKQIREKALVADFVTDRFVSDYGRTNRRLRVIYDNGTESDLLARSLQRALYKDEASRRIVEPAFGPLFTEVEEEGDLATGYIYVLRSKSAHPFIAEHRSLIHKIGLTGGDVKSRVANAKKEPTYLLADVEIVATYKLANVSLKSLEKLLHRIFGAARLDLELKDRFGSQVEPREWFLVPLGVIDDAIQKLREGTIDGFRYDPETACLTRE